LISGKRSAGRKTSGCAERSPRSSRSCGSGISATVALLALERIGVHCDGVFDGSFNEWSADPAREVAFGHAT
jgi:3-mercaptopyruvate sulfurtransferase SseA